MSDFRRCLILGVFGILAARTAGAAEGTVDPTAGPLEDLRAANVARSAQGREWQEWQLESERSYALLDGVQSQVARLRAEATAAHETAAKLGRESDAAGQTRRQLDRLAETFASQAASIAAALARARAASAPGTVPAVAEAGDARGRFASAVRALETAEHAAAASVVEVVEGDLAGQARAVTMLRVAGLGWWCEIDGPRAGIVEPQPSGRPRLVEDPGAADAIRRAIAIAQGARPPELVLLPVRAAAIDSSGDGK